MAYTPPPGSGLGNGNGNGSQKALSRGTPVLAKTKAIGYNATTSDQIFAISSAASSTTKESMPAVVDVKNTGGVPVMLMIGYETYSDDTSDGVVEYLHTMLTPGQTFTPPLRAVIRTGESTVIMDGTAVDNSAPDSNEYTDSTANVDDATAAGVVSSDSSTLLYLEPYTSAANCAANLFRVGDLIRIDDEIMEVTGIGTKAGLSTNTLTVKRGMYGSTAAADAADGDPVRLPFFNAYHDYDKFSVAQTDSNGKFKCFNFFGLGRAATEVQGIVPGSVAIKFYEPGYQELGLSGINQGTNSGLTASTAYAFDIQVDGGSNFDNLTFTTDSSNVAFGGTNGVISKIQSALNTQYYTSGNLFEKKVSVGVVNGDIRFTSGSHLSTSAIALTAEDGSDASFFGTGRIPAVGSIRSAVAAKLPDDVVYDRITYATSPNSSVFLYDNSYGGLIGNGSGAINYETGAIDMLGCPPNAEFVISCLHTSAFSGKLNEGETDRVNSLVDIYANTTNQKENTSIDINVYPPGRQPPPTGSNVNPRIMEMP